MAKSGGGPGGERRGLEAAFGGVRTTLAEQREIWLVARVAHEQVPDVDEVRIGMALLDQDLLRVPDPDRVPGLT